MSKKWTGEIPPMCDICGDPLTKWFVDGGVSFGGSWCIMCPGCFAFYGLGLGTGLGQKYNVVDGKKVAG